MMKREYLAVPKGVDKAKEEQFFLLANLSFGLPSCGRIEMVRSMFQKNPDYVLRLSGMKGYLERGRGVPFVELAFQNGYSRSNMSRLYVRYVNWYFRNELKVRSE